jgi:hypothetical protein
MKAFVLFQPRCATKLRELEKIVPSTDTLKLPGSELYPSFRILKIRKHGVSETGSVFVLRRKEEDIYTVGSLRKG